MAFATFMPQTYLQACLKDDFTLRWPDSAMPLSVYVAPFRWYQPSKQANAAFYHQMAVNAFLQWQQRSDGLVRFHFVDSVSDSQIDLKWRRVDRKTLGHCEFSWNDQHCLYSAEIQIGITDGLVHSQYDKPEEVQHTILHEIGHALGLTGHSPYSGDIMYVPHQYGVLSLSERDVETLKWLYRLPLGFNYHTAAAQMNLKMPYDMDQVMAHLTGESRTATAFSHALLESGTGPHASSTGKLDIHGQQDFLSQQGQFLMATSMIQVDTTTWLQPEKPSNPFQTKRP